MYRLFLYKTSGVTGDASCISMANRTLEKNAAKSWEENETERFMLKFNAEKVKREIEAVLGNGTYKIHIQSSPKKKISYICIISPDDEIKRVISVAHSIAVQNNLVLYDDVKKRSFYYKDLYDTVFMTVRKRISEINRAIQKSVKLYRIRKLSFFDGERDKIADYVVTLKKVKGVSLETRVEEIYTFLKSVLLKNEKLYTNNRCFTVKGEFYEISYTLEAYGKHADRVGYVAEEHFSAELLCRMSCEAAFKWAKENMTVRNKKYGYCMYVTEMVEAFPNPADRFVKGINIKKHILKEKFRYDYCGYYGGAIDFKTVFPYKTYEPAEVSVLSIDEDDALPLLKVISKFYPYFSDRYYESNHLPAEMVRDIINEMKKVRELLINNVFSEKLKPYLTQFYALTYDCDENSKKLYDENLIEFLHLHRYEAAGIYDIFIEWAESQLKVYDTTGEGLMFNVEGP